MPADQVILGNSTSCGLHLLVQGIPWREGDEVLLVDGDFPRHRRALAAPWPSAGSGPAARAGGRGAGGRAAGGGADPGDPADGCTSWVFSFTGHMIDLAAVGRVCRRAGVTFVVNGSQAVGAVPSTWPTCRWTRW